MAEEDYSLMLAWIVELTAGLVFWTVSVMVLLAGAYVLLVRALTR